MLEARPDTSFGNRGTMWSGVPYLWTDPSSYTIERLDDETHYPGGSAVGIHQFSNGSACVVLWGYDYLRPGYDFNVANSPPVVRLVVFPPGGRPDDGNWRQAAVLRLTPKGEGATPLGSCKIAGDRVAILLRRAAAQHELITFRPSGPGANIYPGAFTQRTIPAAFLDYGTGLGTPAQTGSVLIAPRIGDLAIASSNGSRIRLSLAVEQIYDLDLANNNMLPGLIRLELAGLRFDGDFMIIAMTAHLNHPGVGGTSVAAVLHLRPDGSRDTTFGNNGLWVSPLSVNHRGFVCAGEFGGIVAGCVGRRAVVFALDRNSPGGDGLDMAFGAGNGFVEHNLGGTLGRPVASADATALYIFAQRVPVQGDPSGDLRAVGCRVSISNSAFGVVDTGFGNGGSVALFSDGAALQPSGIALSGSELYLGGTRALPAEDCDRVPVVVAMNAANGDPISNFGFGGFSLHSSIRSPAFVASDGTCVFADRTKAATRPALRFILPSGEAGPLVPLPPSFEGAVIHSILGLPDGSLIISGSETTVTNTPGWVAKLTPARAIDTSFGTAGVFLPKSTSPWVKILGLRTDGKVALQVDDELAVMQPSGQLESTFGTNGFVRVEGFMHPGVYSPSVSCFLDEGDAIVCVAHSGHDPQSSSSPFTRLALRRITSEGVYDAAFGLGVPSVAAPSNDVMATLISPSGGNLEFSSVQPRALWRAGGNLYLFAAGFAGGGFNSGANRYLPSYPVFMIFRWKSDGKRDLSFFNTGWQESGFSPYTVYWAPTGVLGYGPETAIVYGIAGRVEKEQHSVVGGSTYTVSLIRPPKPALFKFDHPTGLDLSFAQSGAARYMLWEPILVPADAALLSGGRVRVACVDVLGVQRSSRPLTNFAGLVQWQMVEGISSPTFERWPKWGTALMIGGLTAALALVLKRWRRKDRLG